MGGIFESCFIREILETPPTGVKSIGGWEWGKLQEVACSISRRADIRPWFFSKVVFVLVLSIILVGQNNRKHSTINYNDDVILLLHIINAKGR